MSSSSGISPAFQFDEKRDYEIRRSRKSRSNSQSSTISTSTVYSVSSNGSTHSRNSSYSSPDGSPHSRNSSYSSPYAANHSSKPLPSLPTGKSPSRRVHFRPQKPLPLLPLTPKYDDDLSHIGESRKRSRSEGDYAWWAHQQCHTRNESWSGVQQKQYSEKETILGERERMSDASR